MHTSVFSDAAAAELQRFGHAYLNVVFERCFGSGGGLGIAPGSNIGMVWVFEATHGTAPEVCGYGCISPSFR